MANETIDIKIREDGSRVVQRNLETIGQAAEKSAASVGNLNKSFSQRLQTNQLGYLSNELKRMQGTARQFTSELGATSDKLNHTAGSANLLRDAFIAIGGLAIVAKTEQLADAYTSLQNRIRLVTKSNEELNAVTSEVFEIANKTRQSYETVATVYSRTASASKTLGVSQRDVLDFTLELNQAVALSGATSIEASQGLIQLSQGMSRGKLQSQDLKAVLEELPAVSDVIAKSLHVTRGQLQKMGEEGKITAQQILKAFKESREELADKFAKSVPTLGQAFEVLNNQMGRFVGEANTSAGVTAALARGLIVVADHIPEITKAVAALGVGALIVLPSVAAAFYAASASVQAFTASLFANPMTLLVASIAAVVSALILFRDEITGDSEYMVSFGDYLRAAWDIFKDSVLSLVDDVKFLWKVLSDGASDTLGHVANTFKDIFGFIGDTVFGGLKITFTDVFGFLKQTLNDIINSFISLAKVVSVLVTELPKVVLPEAIGGISAKKLGDDLISAFTSTNTEADHVKTAIEAVGGAFDTLREKAHGISYARQALAEVQNRQVDLTQKGAKVPVVDDKEAKAKEALRARLRNLLETLNPVIAASFQEQEAQDLVTKATEKGIISQQDKINIMGQVVEKYKDQLDPVAALNRELAKEFTLAGMTSREREVENNALSVQQKLKSEGVSITAEELNGYRETFKKLQDLNEVNQAKEQILDRLHGKQRDAVIGENALRQALAEHRVSLIEFNQALIALKIDAGTATFSQAFIGQLDIMQDGMRLFTNRAAEQFSHFTDGMIDGFSEAAAKSILFGDSFSDAISRVSRDALTELVAGLIKVGVQMALNAALGTTLSEASAATSIATNAATGAAIAAAMTPAAVLVSLATSGANSAPAIAGMTTAAAVGASIALPKYRTGGDFTVGGVGGIDSQMVAFRATPGEKVNINTPAQARAKESGGDTNVSVPLRIVNTIDPSVTIDAMSSKSGERVIFNHIQNNKGAYQRLLNG